MSDAIKFPKTPRLAAITREDVYGTWKHAFAVVEEKVDGANVGIWFKNGELRLQSRGHVLRGGPDERQFASFHGWASSRLDSLRETLGERFVVYGEWCFAKHKAYYDALPDWMLGCDVIERESGRFLGVHQRDNLLAACRIQAVARLWSGDFGKASAFGTLLGPSRYKTVRWRDALGEAASLQHVPLASILLETDDSDAMEGIYVRVEDDTGVIGRMKLHRDGYVKVRSDHWRDRPLIRNRLRVGVGCAPTAIGPSGRTPGA